ncbi:restriction endonuclease subunit S, partial [Clostridium perfringens]
MNFKENELIETTLSEISIDGKGSYGISASAVEYSNNLYTYLRITDITDNGKLIKDGLKSVDDENAYKYILKPNDIVFARTGNSTGRSYFYDGSDGELVYAGFLIKFSLDSKKVNPKFMRYYTLSEEYRKWVASFSTGSTRGNINAKTYGNMKIRLPERKQQDFLVEILSDLDEKIEVNNKINKNLEEMAQAIFKQWFVDFEFP